ncbi:MAG TPA: trigger factor [Phycisphaerales bacterium]|nr:trigger factor [Phycisphaerales bacterium]
MAATKTKGKADQQDGLKNLVKIEDSGPCSKKIKIEVPAEKVAEQLGTTLDTLMLEAELPGFRRGRAPRRLIEKRFGDGIRKEAKSNLVSAAIREAVEEHKIRLVGDPIGNEELVKAEVEDGKPLKFEIEVEVAPTFDLPKLEGISIKKPTLVVDDEMVGKEIDRLLLNEGSLKDKAQPGAGDYLTGHAIMKDDEGTKHLDIADAVIQIPAKDNKEGKGMILGVMVDDFAKQIGHPKIGDTITIKTTGPENHETEAIRGKKLTITFEIKRADEIVPASMSEIVERYGMKDEAEVRGAIRQRIEQRLQVEQGSLMRQQLAKFLLENTTMELPKRVTATQAQRNLDRARFDLMHRGWDQARIEEHMAELRSASSDAAVRETKLFFILDRAAEHFNVQVNDAELNGRIAQMAFSRGDRPERLRQEIIQRGQIPTLFLQVREQKTMDMILGKADVQEVGVEEFNKLMGGEDKGEAKAPAKKKAEKKDDDDAGETGKKPAAKGKKKE